MGMNFHPRVLVISLAIFMPLQWPISRELRGNALPERIIGIPCRGEAMALIAIAMSFATVTPMGVGLSKRPNGAKMAVFHPIGAMAFS